MRTTGKCMKNLLLAFKTRSTEAPSLQSPVINPQRDLLGSLTDPRRLHAIKTTQTSRKSLIINKQASHPRPKSVRKSPLFPFHPPFYTEPIRSNPDLRAETCAPGFTGLEGSTLKVPPAYTNLHLLAPTCTYLRQLASTCGKKFIFRRVRAWKRIFVIKPAVQSLF
jgi:hypothetical protein